MKSSVTHTHMHTQTGAGCVMPLLPSGPAASWHLPPVTVETADCIISAHQRGTALGKSKTISPCFHLPSSVKAASSCLLSSSDPLSLQLGAFISPSLIFSFHPKKKKKKSDTSTVSHSAENVAHASKHKIAPRPSSH